MLIEDECRHRDKRTSFSASDTKCGQRLTDIGMQYAVYSMQKHQNPITLKKLAHAANVLN